MILPTTKGDLYLADSPRELSARRYLLFNQAWAQEVGAGTSMYDADNHFARTGLFLSKNDLQNALIEHNNTIILFTNLTSGAPVHYQCAVLAPLATRYSDDLSEAGLEATANYLAEVLTQQQVAEAVEESKKNFRPN